MRRLGCGLFLLLVLAGLALAADQWIAAEAESRAEAALRERLGAEADVELSGWPVGLRLLVSTVPRATVTATGLEAGGVRLARVTAELTDVDVPLDAESLPTAATADFTAEVDEEALRQALGAPDRILSLDLRPGVAVMDALGLEVEADVVARDGDVVVEPRDALSALLALGSLRVDLSGAPGGPVAREVEVREGSLVVRGVLSDIASG